MTEAHNTICKIKLKIKIKAIINKYYNTVVLNNK